ncbi:MAG TPA: hypothetical protein VFU22_08005 [Roseiflexaceae bacterium]|nr:hypothetical protein [Roseiflexaceae bacterium]
MPEESARLSVEDRGETELRLRPEVLNSLVARRLPLRPVAGPTLSLPQAPGVNPFTDLPMPSPGDRIKSDDFKKLSQSLRIVYDSYVLSGALFGRSFGEAKMALISQNYEIVKIMTVFGAEIDDLENTSLDSRKVVQVSPAVLGERRVVVVLTEAVDTRRFAPNLLGLTYKEGVERLSALLGDTTSAGPPINAAELVGLSLAAAKDAIAKK